MSTAFNPEATYVLEDDRVLLRPLQKIDLDYLLPFAINDPIPGIIRSQALPARMECGLTSRQLLMAVLQVRNILL
ncbi:hypothetical protein SNE26_06950 [Mucilaginibacter sp. cycad4]|uniref:hypothetical protein n=1 Tax=Mucilaginibacter sp. cycad4 TaxID=3342096 RepID=UPI002AAB65C4|nr:hypothetical protein [Mucilaginibacter gossypii]WPV01508.1 hypothetical protein SNE26_06950 [Mucilaginibacter gossypii]